MVMLTARALRGPLSCVFRCCESVFFLLIFLLTTQPAGAAPVSPERAPGGVAGTPAEVWEMPEMRGAVPVLLYADTVRAKSPRRALLLSLGGTLAMGVPIVNLAALPLGPALGHFYAGNDHQAWVGIGIRTGAIAGAMLLIMGAALDGSKSTPATIDRYLYGATAVILGSAIYDIATAPAAARRANERLGISALVLPAPGGAHVRLAMRL